MHLRLPPGNRAPVRVLAAFSALDEPAAKLGKVGRSVIRPGPLKEALSGSWQGHPLHPALTDVTIGTFTSALLLDWLGGKQSGPAARRLIGIGVLSAAPTATSGYSDWADTEVGNPAARRIGLVHAASNLAGSSLFAASWLARRRGGSGRLLALAGGAAIAAGGYLGGHLSFAEGVGVDQNAFEDAPEGWTDVLAADALGEGEKTCVVAEGTPVMVARVGGKLHALSDHCAHRGGPLHEGELKDGTITCPWHHSVFAVEDGALIHGPAAYPQPAWETRVREGRVEVRRR
jgi:nitrite reductase/ring-hydroxylating ferredoxin subunit